MVQGILRPRGPLPVCVLRRRLQGLRRRQAYLYQGLLGLLALGKRLAAESLDLPVNLGRIRRGLCPALGKCRHLTDRFSHCLPIDCLLDQHQRRLRTLGPFGAIVLASRPQRRRGRQANLHQGLLRCLAPG